MCLRCRTMTSFNQEARRKKLVRTGACPKCGGPRDDGNSVMFGLSGERARPIQQRRKAGPGTTDQAPAPARARPKANRVVVQAMRRTSGTIQSLAALRGLAGRTPTEFERRRVGRLEASAEPATLVSRATCHNPDLTFKLCPKCRSTRADASRRKRAEAKMAQMAPPPLTAWGVNRLPTGEIFE